MVHEIRNSCLKVGVDTLGAELSQLQTSDGTDYLWPGSRDSWAGRSPVLFPIIGGLQDDQYTLGERTYKMAPHGFARRRQWSLKDRGDHHLTFQLKADPETLADYPFDFRLRVTYRIDSLALTVEYGLRNSGNRTMLFSLGGHPGFRCPLEKGLKFEDYRLIFNKPENTVRLMKSGGLLTGETRPFKLPDGVLPLRHRDFEEGPVILRKIASDSVILESVKGLKRVKVDFPGFTDLGLWTFGPSPAPFICIEPWFGTDSTSGVPGDCDLQTKAGMRTLKAGEDFKAAFTITLK